MRRTSSSGMYSGEEKKEASSPYNNSGYSQQSPDEKQSNTSYRSTHSSRSSVLERAREYNRRVEASQPTASSNTNRRSHSMEQRSTASSSSSQRRSVSTGRVQHRAMEQVRRDQQQRRSTIHTSNRSVQSSQAKRSVQTKQSSASRNNSLTSRRQHSTASSSHFPSRVEPPEEPQEEEEDGQEKAVVTPELLVDALSGHEDGLLAIAEKLMEHYDGGYDVMGEAIIDAFADVQKLFQHVVEAAHMEGAAFEASRRQQEDERGPVTTPRHHTANTSNNTANNSAGGSGPVRHDEFIDQDVKDVLNEAIRRGTALRNENKDTECLRMYESACTDASSLLPVDSDHRGRLQLSLARAESMSADRACAILRYAMDDVLRSGLKATPLPDPSTRADVVLPPQTTTTHAFVNQSSTEALASYSAELKEILQAPIYNDTPLQSVAERFWQALQESQSVQQKKQEKLEQNLASLKGEFLLARAEWEEKYNRAQERCESYKSRYEQSMSRNNTKKRTDESVASDDNHTMYGSVKSAASKAETVASGMSGLALHAKTLVMNSNFNCTAPSGTPTTTKEEAFTDLHMRYEQARPSSRGRPHSNRRSSRSRSKNSRSFREYSRSPHRVDV